MTIRELYVGILGYRNQESGHLVDPDPRQGISSPEGVCLVQNLGNARVKSLRTWILAKKLTLHWNVRKGPVIGKSVNPECYELPCSEEDVQFFPTSTKTRLKIILLILIIAKTY